MARDMVGQGSGNLGTPVERLREHTGAVAEDLRELGRVTKDAARDKFVEARDATTEAVQRGSQRLMDGTVDTVKNRPMQSMCVALGAGVVLGYFLARRR